MPAVLGFVLWRDGVVWVLGFRVFRVGVVWVLSCCQREFTNADSFRIFRVVGSLDLSCRYRNPPMRAVLGFRVFRVGLGFELPPKGIHQRGQF